jgi:hypothetical protein
LATTPPEPIDGQSIAGLGRKSVEHLLCGPSGSTVEVGVVPGAGGPPRSIRLVREAVSLSQGRPRTRR